MQADFPNFFSTPKHSPSKWLLLRFRFAFWRMKIMGQFKKPL